MSRISPVSTPGPQAARRAAGEAGLLRAAGLRQQLLRVRELISEGTFPSLRWVAAPFHTKRRKKPLRRSAAVGLRAARIWSRSRHGKYPQIQ